MTTVHPPAASNLLQEARSDQSAQAEVARTEVFGSLLRSVGSRRSTVETSPDAPMTRKSRGALLERGGGVKDLRLSDAAKLDYGSMAALELAGAGPVSGLPEPEPPSDPEGRADRGRTREPVSEHAPTHAQRGPREPHAEIAGAAGPRAPVGHAAVAAAPSVQLSPAAEAVNSARPGMKVTSATVAAASGRPAQVPVPAAGRPALSTPARSDAARAQIAAGPSTHARASAQKLLGKLENAARDTRETAPHVRQFARAMLAAVRHGQGDISLRLLPEALGRVTVRLGLGEEGVSASFLPETEPARRLLDASRDELRAALEARGLRVERIEIDTSRVEPAGTAGPEAGLRADTGRHDGGAGGDDRAGAERTPGESGEPATLELEVPVDASWIDGVSGRVDTLA